MILLESNGKRVALAEGDAIRITREDVETGLRMSIEHPIYSWEQPHVVEMFLRVNYNQDTESFGVQIVDGESSKVVSVLQFEGISVSTYN